MKRKTATYLRLNEEKEDGMDMNTTQKQQKQLNALK
jgi:hypothetical protein